MCGIVGFFSRRAPNSEAALRRATLALNHRGPDGQRQWISQDGKVGLGHARLSIIDLTTGDQPIASEDDQTQSWSMASSMATNRSSENSNDRDIASAHDPTAKSPFISMKILELQCLHHLRGEFAFVLWDETNRTIFAARDRFGIKPLFYAFHEETLYLASEAKALFAAGVPARWDPSPCHHSVEYGGHPNAYALRWSFSGSARTLPARDRQAHPVHQYWDFNYPARERAAALPTPNMQRNFASARRGGADPSPRRRPGRLLPQRRAGFLRGAGTRGAASSRIRFAPSP